MIQTNEKTQLFLCLDKVYQYYNTALYIVANILNNGSAGYAKYRQNKKTLCQAQASDKERN